MLARSLMNQLLMTVLQSPDVLLVEEVSQKLLVEGVEGVELTVEVVLPVVVVEEPVPMVINRKIVPTKPGIMLLGMIQSTRLKPMRIE